MVATKKARTVTPKQLDNLIDRLWNQHGFGVQVNIMDIPKIYADARQAFVRAGCPKSDAVEAAITPSILESVTKYRCDMPTATNREAARLFVGVFPTCIVYADRMRELDSDYLTLARLPYRTLVLEWADVTMPPELRAAIERDAARMAARKGERFSISGNASVVLGTDH
jgi:hypothetical protein